MKKLPIVLLLVLLLPALSPTAAVSQVANGCYPFTRPMPTPDEPFVIGQPVRLRILGDGDRLPGNYGWLSWNGSNSTDDLVGSLTPPGNSHTYYNPGTPDNGWTPDYTDRDLDLGDWVQGCPGNKNEDAVRDLLDDMWVNSGRVAVIPLYDAVAGRGAHAYYRVRGFAAFTLTGYDLSGKDSVINAVFVKWVINGD